MATDPVEQAVSEGVHAALNSTHPQLVREMRQQIKSGWPKGEILRVIRAAAKPGSDMRRWLETELDYLITESKREA